MDVRTLTKEFINSLREETRKYEEKLANHKKLLEKEKSLDLEKIGNEYREIEEILSTYETKDCVVKGTISERLRHLLSQAKVTKEMELNAEDCDGKKEDTLYWKSKYERLKSQFMKKAEDWKNFRTEYEKRKLLKSKHRTSTDVELHITTTTAYSELNIESNALDTEIVLTSKHQDESQGQLDQSTKIELEKSIEEPAKEGEILSSQMSTAIFTHNENGINPAFRSELDDQLLVEMETAKRGHLELNTFSDLSLSQLRKLNMEQYNQESVNKIPKMDTDDRQINCPCCQKYFNAVGMTEHTKLKASRHRHQKLTPPGFWDVDFHSSGE